MAYPTPAQLWRLSLRMHRQLQPRGNSSSLGELPVEGWQRCLQLSRLLETARRQGWHTAERVCRGRLRRALGELKPQLEEAQSELERTRAAFVPSVRDLYEDLTALASDFTDVDCDCRGTSVTATTPPVVLDGVYLGSFRVCLDWHGLVDGTPSYTIVAVDPHPSGVDSSVTHPHVRDDHLCEGEAYGAIRSALSSGRILDFFSVVAQTLATYNPESAYVSLDAWEGVSCADCGCTTSDEDRTSCERCDCDLCSDCVGSCSACGRSSCSDCSGVCHACNETQCTACLSDCQDCHKSFCEGCLTDDQCDNCRTAATAEEACDVRADGSPAAPANAAADSLRLG